MKLTYKIDNEISLRLIEPQHAGELYTVIDTNRDVILPWMRWVNEVTDVAAVSDYIRQWLIQTSETGCLSLGVELKGELVGAVFHVRPDLTNKQVEIGYWLAKSARGRGVVTRAVRALCDITFRDLGFNRINVRVAPENNASLAVAERLGFTREGLSRQAWLEGDKFWDAVEFGLLAEDWDVTLSAFSLTHQVDDDIALGLPVRHLAEQVTGLIETNRDHISRWLSWCTPEYGLTDTHEFISANLKRLADGGGLGLWIYFRGELVGGVGNPPVDKANRSADVGYWLNEAAQGQGIVTRATRAMVDYSFIDMKLNRVTIHAAKGNDRSLAVPQRLGFQKDGEFRKPVCLHGEFVDVIQYAMLVEDWKAEREVGP